MGCAQEDGKLYSKGKYEEVVGVKTSKIEQNRRCYCCMLAFLNKISECNDSRYVFLGCYNVPCNYVLCYCSEIVHVCGSLFLRCFWQCFIFFISVDVLLQIQCQLFSVAESAEMVQEKTDWRITNWKETLRSQIK